MARTFDPGKVIVTFAGNLITGFAAGTFISAERAEDTFSAEAGASGEVARVRNRNKLGTVTLTLMQTSPSNDVLSAQAKRDELSGTGAGSLLVKDLGGTTLIASPSAWIKKPPAVEFAKELSNREWVLEGELDIFAGSNL
jgi:hypothetical protein